MPSFGEKLKAERERRSITLEQISLTTKISTRMLQALELDKFDQLPGGIFNKGFIRAYARVIGLDEEQAVADYLEAAGEEPPQFRGGIDPSFPVAPRVFEEDGPGDSATPSRDLPWGTFAVALLLLALGLSLWTRHKRATARIEPAPVIAAQASPEASPGHVESAPTPASSTLEDATSSSTTQIANPSEPKAVSEATPKPAPLEKNLPGITVPRSVKSSQSEQTLSTPQAIQPLAAPQSGGFTVSIQVREDSWISISADGKNLASYLAGAGSQRLVRGHEMVTIKTGNVGGVDFLFNGKKLQPQGQPGQVKTLTFGPDGLQPAPLPAVVQQPSTNIQPQ